MAQMAKDALLDLPVTTYVDKQPATTVVTYLDAFGGKDGQLFLCSLVRDGDKTTIVGLETTSSQDEAVQRTTVTNYIKALRDHSTLGGLKHELIVNTAFLGGAGSNYWVCVARDSFPEMKSSGRCVTLQVHTAGFDLVRAALLERRVSLYATLVPAFNQHVIDFQRQCRRVMDDVQRPTTHDLMQAFYTTVGFCDLPVLTFFQELESNASDWMESGDTTVTTFVNSSTGARNAKFSIASFIRHFNTIFVVGLHTQSAVDSQSEFESTVKYFDALQCDSFLGSCKHILVQDPTLVGTVTSERVASAAKRAFPTIEVRSVPKNEQTWIAAFRRLVQVIATHNVTLHTSIIGVSPATIRSSLQAFDQQCASVKSGSDRETMESHDLLDAFGLGLMA